MKTNLKLIAVLFCFYFTSTAALAQKAQSNAPFLGIWELYKVASNGQPLQDYPPGYIKIYEPNGTFNIIRVQKGGSIIKGSGFYIIDDEETCREAEKAEDLVSKATKISYEFTENQKVLTIGFSYPNGAAYTESYRKLEAPKP